jgi:NADPH-dependent ferric siderophore reductase
MHSDTPVRHHIERVRRDVRRRAVTVTAATDLTPRMRRITLAGDELAGFESSAYDDHIKLFVPVAGAEPIARNITPRRFDPHARSLLVDIALHDGPIGNWARDAALGSPAWVGGPRGSYVVAADFDWYVFLGDETALPAIGRRLEELPAGARAVVVVEVAEAAEEQPLPSRAATDVTWLHRGTADPGTTTLLRDALTRLVFPPGDGYVWAACESEVAQTLRADLLARGVAREWLRVSAYWKRDRADVHETLND